RNEWANYTAQIYAGALFGTTPSKVNSGEEIAALRKGFNVPISTGTNLLDCFSELNTVALVNSFRGKFISSSRLLIDHIRYPGLATSPNNTFIPAFKQKLDQYLNGSGHPRSLVGSLISVEMGERDNYPLYRCERLLLQARGTLLLPFEDNWSIEINFHFNPPDNREKVVYRQCFNTIDITVPPWLMSSILNPSAAGDEDVEFCSFFHKTVIPFEGSTSDYEIA
ncbi:hypothetical protein VNI00_017587, partial [Paramarasmius palmivorus]